jgi:hypothetical protein
MLQKKSVRKPLWDLLKDLQKSDIFNDYFLVGGTAPLRRFSRKGVW